MKIVVFGGTGAMGAPLVKALVDEGHDVYVTSRRERKYDRESIHCLTGNAHDMGFLREVLKERFDVLVDFMSYKSAEMEERLELILGSVGQYIFLSSCRVYAPSDKPLTEQSPRLLDVCMDRAFMSTDEYPLAKAREENILLASRRKNWTIIRPGLTYNVGRQQLGSYELVGWLYRLLKGRTLVFSEDLMETRAAMTFGGDTAAVIAELVGNQKAYGEIFQISTPETMKWKDILRVYRDTLSECGGVSLKIHMERDGEETAEILGRKWRFKYATLPDRAFSDAKIEAVCGHKIAFTPMEEGLRRCLRQFLDGERRFHPPYWKNEAYQDRVTGERTPLSELPSWKSRMAYLVGRYTPFFRMYVGLKRLSERK